MDSPPISVVIPDFNPGAFLPAAVQSVLNQSYGSFELLIIDDASSDATPRIAQAFAARDARVHYYRNPANLGVARSRNRGVALWGLGFPDGIVSIPKMLQTARSTGGAGSP